MKRSHSLRISLMSDSAGEGAPPPAIPPPTAEGRVPEPRPAEKRSIPPNIQQVCQAHQCTLAEG